MSNTEKPQLTKEQEQTLRDEQTVFALAVLMMEVHVGTLLKDKNQVANAFLKTGVVLRGNPGFPERFKGAQATVIKALEQVSPGRAFFKEAAPNIIRSPSLNGKP